MQLGLKLNRNGTAGLRDQIVTQLARLILDGHLQPGMRLPSCRKFAKELEVSINTVIAAYEILEGAAAHPVKEPIGLLCARGTGSQKSPARKHEIEQALTAARPVELATTIR